MHATCTVIDPVTSEMNSEVSAHGMAQTTNFTTTPTCLHATHTLRPPGSFASEGWGVVETSLSNREKIGSKETICAKHGTTKDVLVLTKKGRVGLACAHRVRRAVFHLEHLPRALRIYYIHLSSKPSKRFPRALLPHRVPPSGHEHLPQHLPCGQHGWA